MTLAWQAWQGMWLALETFLGDLLSAPRGFPSPVVRGKVADWTEGIKQRSTAFPALFKLSISFNLLGKGGNFPKEVVVCGGRLQNPKTLSGRFPTKGGLKVRQALSHQVK